MAYLLPFFWLSVFTWAYPQPQHSAGLLVIYGDKLIEANAAYHGYDLAPYPNRCGLASISPAMLGRIAYVRRDGYDWIGPCLVIDVVARNHAYDSIYVRHEVAEISYRDAATLGYDNGGRDGYVWFGKCPPSLDYPPPALPYAPPLVWDYPPYERTPSFYPFPAQELPIECLPKYTGWEHGALDEMP